MSLSCCSPVPLLTWSLIYGKYNGLKTLSPKQPVSPSIGGVRNFSTSTKNVMSVQLLPGKSLISGKYNALKTLSPKQPVSPSIGGVRNFSTSTKNVMSVKRVPGKLLVPSTFQEFENKLLGIPHLVDRVTVYKSHAVVYVKSSLVDSIDVSKKQLIKDSHEESDKIAFFFEIESVESFKKKLKEAQRALGIDPRKYIRVERCVRLINRFHSWMIEHNKFYENFEEKVLRLEVFKDKLEHINKRNKELSGYRVGLNNFSDMTHEEFKSKYLMSEEFIKKSNRDEVTVKSIQDQL